MGNLSKNVKNNYVNLSISKTGTSLWRRPVENSVENVEKFRFSTGKPPDFPF